MWRGLYTAATGMVSESYRIDSIANNLANANTTGFKRDDAVVKEFEPMLLHRINDGNNRNNVTAIKDFSVDNNRVAVKEFTLTSSGPLVGKLGLGSQVDEIVTDFSQGVMITSGNPLDLAISGDGYFAIETPQGVRYTRDGSFYRASDGYLVNSNGQHVLDERGRGIIIPPEANNIVIGATGRISAGTQGQVERGEIARLQFVEFDDDRNQLEKIGDNQYRALPGVTPGQATGSIQQGMLERSNTNVVGEMVNMIASYRAYEASSKAVITQDTLLDKAVNEVGRLS